MELEAGTGVPKVVLEQLVYLVPHRGHHVADSEHADWASGGAKLRSDELRMDQQTCHDARRSVPVLLSSERPLVVLLPVTLGGEYEQTYLRHEARQ